MGQSPAMEIPSGADKTYTLVHLLPTNIMQPAVQITNPLHDILHLVLIFGLNLARFANGNIQGHLNGTLGAGEPATGGGVGLSGEADAVLTGISGREGEAAGVVLALRDDAVVVVESLIDGDEHLQARVDGIGV